MKLIELLILKFISLTLQIQKSDGIIINCEFANYTDIEDFPAYKCISNSIENYATKALESVTGYHEVGLTNADVDGLVLMETTIPILDYIPDNIMEIFPKLTLLTIGLTNMSKITSDDMRQFPALRAFESFFNPITSLPGDLFKNNPELRIVNFYGSLSETPNNEDSLTGIGENIFGRLEHLTEVSFAYHFCIPDNAFASTRREVFELNQRLPVMCPYANVPTDAPTTTEGQTSTTQTDEQTSTTSEQNLSSSSVASTPTTSGTTSTERTTTSGQNSLVNEHQKLKIFSIVSVILITISKV